MKNWKTAPAPSYHLLLVLVSFQMAVPMIRGRMANLLPLPHLVFEHGTGHIHPCSGTGSVKEASPKYTRQPPEKGSGVTVQQGYLPLQVSSESSWNSTDELWTASEPGPTHIPPPGAEETPFTACSLAWSLLARTTLPLCCGSEATGNAFISIWQVYGQTSAGSWCGFLWGPSQDLKFVSTIRFLLLEKETFLSIPWGIIPCITHGHTFCGLEALYLLFLSYTTRLRWELCQHFFFSVLLFPYLYGHYLMDRVIPLWLDGSNLCFRWTHNFRDFRLPFASLN